MDSRFRAAALKALLLVALALAAGGCVSFRWTQSASGREVPRTLELIPGRTALGEVLETLGAPERVAGLDGSDLLVYERAIFKSGSLSVSVPLAETIAGSAEVSASGDLARYDRLTLFFTPDGVLERAVVERGTDRPFFRTLLKSP